MLVYIQINLHHQLVEDPKRFCQTQNTIAKILILLKRKYSRNLNGLNQMGDSTKTKGDGRP